MSRPVEDCEGCPALAGVRNLGLDDPSAGRPDSHCNFGAGASGRVHRRAACSRFSHATCLSRHAPPRTKAGNMIPTSDVDLYGGRTVLEPHEESPVRACGCSGRMSTRSVVTKTCGVYCATPRRSAPGRGRASTRSPTARARGSTRASDGDTHYRFRQVIGRAGDGTGVAGGNLRRFNDPYKPSTCGYSVSTVGLETWPSTGTRRLESDRRLTVRAPPCFGPRRPQR